MLDLVAESTRQNHKGIEAENEKVAAMDDDNTIGLERVGRMTIIAFFVFGTLSYFAYSLILAGAQDILAGTWIQTSTVLIANVFPKFLVSLIVPYFMKTVSYTVRISAVTLTYTSGALMVAVAEQVHWKLIGIGLASFAFGVSEVTISALTSFYHGNCLTVYSAGTGTGFVIAPLYYLAMTTWACVSPQITIAATTTLYVLIFVCYYLMDKKCLESLSPPGDCKHSGVEYTALETKEDEDDHSENSGNGTLSHCTKFQIIWEMLPDLLPLFIGWLTEYMIIQSVVTTIAFPNAPFEPRDHYQYYIFALTAGEVLGRSYLFALSFIKEEWIEKVKFRPYLWIPAAIQVAMLVVLIFAAWYRYLTNVWFVLLILFSSGLDIGGLYGIALTFFRGRFVEPYREFAMGYIIIALDAGVLAAALISLIIEPLLLKHCQMVSPSNTEVCFTRSTSLERFNSFCSSR